MNEANPAFLGALLTGLTVIIGLAVAWKKFSGSPEPRTVSPQPLMVSQAPEFTRQPDCTAKHAEVNERIRAVEERANVSMNLIREELKELRKGQGYLQKRVNNMTRPLYAIAGKMGIVTATEPEEQE